ncbi:hypothetical protein TNCT_203801 [Trichonephila clavata]|uniref:Uncharacterized protein n=1 Tax=Trichonephila clavata TaxID=2740835 RepID=A0A8X6KRT2_TRICU|nr:hypothetical protein TNCT_203801 [Trichonephila clavata]
MAEKQNDTTYKGHEIYHSVFKQEKDFLLEKQMEIKSVVVKSIVDAVSFRSLLCPTLDNQVLDCDMEIVRNTLHARIYFVEEFRKLHLKFTRNYFFANSVIC